MDRVHPTGQLPPVPGLELPPSFGAQGLEQVVVEIEGENLLPPVHLSCVGVMAKLPAQGLAVAGCPEGLAACDVLVGLHRRGAHIRRGGCEPQSMGFD